MSYDDILAKIKKARALADSKKTAHLAGDPIPEATSTSTKKEDSHRASVQQWRKPRDLAPDGKTFLDLFTSRWKCYSKWTDNVKELDNLHNNFKDISVSSYFEIPTDPTVVLSEWSLPPNLRKNVYLDDERASHILEVINSKPEENYVVIGEPGVGKTTLLFEIFDSFMDKVPTGILTTTDITDAHLEFGMKLFYDDIPENSDMVQGIMDSDAKGLWSQLEKLTGTSYLMNSRENLRDLQCLCSQMKMSLDCVKECSTSPI